MSTIEASTTSWGGNTFWGLVQQKGPWKTTRSDQERTSQSKPEYGGGGTGAGGTIHAGHGNWQQVMTPNQINGSSAPLQPSDYAMRSAVMGLVDMKKQTKMGRVKGKLTLASRAPFQTGHKMAPYREEVRYDQPGPIKVQVPLYVQGSFISEIQKQTPTFVPPVPNPDQKRASEIARDDERKDVMQKRSAEFQVGPPPKKHRENEPERPKRKGSLKEESKSKRQETGFGEVGFKRKGEGSEGAKKKSRTTFQGPLKPEEHNVSTKRKAETQLMSEKFKKINTKPKLQINTKDIGKRFMEKKAESKSAPKKFDELPAVKTRSKTK